MRVSTSSFLIAIAGGSGAGKTWLATQLSRLFGNHTARLALDDFYRDRSHLTPERRARINYDHPRAIDWPCVERVLADYRAGRPTQAPRYDFRTHTRTDAAVWRDPKPVVVVDGLWLLRRPAVRRLFDLRVFIECPERVRLARRVARDVADRGRDPRVVRDQFRGLVAPMHRRFVAPQTRWADVILSHPLNATGTNRLADRLWDGIERRSLYPVWMRGTFKAELLALLRPAPTRS